ncbi:transglutaminase domain-containing protein [Cryobacterium sp. TMT1-21]|uniref:transglutaminase-like domain-containing protein n=1 Tax=Cryobacterium sp. TMT1-21 TaxID=1259234 RepID=UPI00106A0327|nr:transglutaminase-like domain-containing protein [Cryobacterium sp. TMT1-21]TFD12171.1 transglutaminase domain-containing protein [Cryobacterium sp. TMT1-21]
MSARAAVRSGARSARPGWRFTVGNTVGLLLATAAAATALWPVYRSREFVVLVGVTFALGAVTAILGAVFRWPAWLVALATIAVYVIAGVPLAIPGQAVRGILPTGTGLLELVSATALSWKQLVTIVLPVGSYQTLLVPAFILVLLSTVIGLSVALRARIGELGALAPAALFIAGIGLGPTVPSAPIATGLALFVVLLFWLLWFRAVRRGAVVRLVAQQSRRTTASTADRRFAAVRGLVGASVIVAVAVAAGTAAAIALPASAPRDVLRARVQQPFDPRDYPSPLSEFRSYLQPARAEAALLEVAGLPEGGRLRLATLDGYDGVVYSVGSEQVSSASGSFTRLPDRLDQSRIDGDQVTLAVTIDGYTGVWVPGAGQLERIRFSGPTSSARSDSFFYNDNSGTAAVLTGLARGESYRSVGVVPRSPDALAGLRPGPAVLPPLSVLPDELEQALAGYVNAEDAPGVQLQSMLDGLRADGYVSHGVGADEPVSRSGHGADRISQLFTDQPMLGDAEQYSVAAALMARRLGFPARVVVGFVPRSGDGAGADATGTVTVVGSDLSAWIEVQSTTGWVTLDPNPPLRDIPAKQPDDPTVVSRPQTVVPPAIPEIAEQRDPAPPENSVEDPPAPLSPFLAFLLAAAKVAGWSLLGLAVVLSPFLLIIAAKARRRRLRRTRPAPLDRIRGGWREFADAALDHGISVPAGATRTELARTVGGMRPLVFAAAVDRAVFAPDRPGSATADEVWLLVAEHRRDLNAGKKRLARLRALVSLRSLGRYAGGASVRRSAPRGGGRGPGGVGS